MGRPIVAVFLLVAVVARGDVAFVSPQRGAQAIGQQLLEVTTDATSVDRVEFYVDDVLVGVARTAPYRVVFDFGTTNVNARVVRAKVLSHGYRRTETVETITAALTAGESINVDVVEVPMRVRSSRPLKPEDVRLRENGVDQTVREIISVRAPAHFAFVVDRSLSMSGGKLRTALQAIDAARKLLRAGDTASLILFNHHVARPVRLEGARTATSVASTPPSGGTSLRDAVASSISSAATRTYVVIITDGSDRNSALSEEQALRRISGTKTVVSAITLGDSSSFLERATQLTGGNLVRAEQNDVGDKLRRILEDINSRYTLVYQSRGTGAGWRTIAITPRRRGTEIVSARNGYFAE